MPLKKLSIPVLPCKFNYGDVLSHQKGGRYTIVGTPDVYVIEETGEPAYAYRGKNGRIWVRSQSKMEDGRFQLLYTADEVDKNNKHDQKLIDDILVWGLIIIISGAVWWFKHS